MAKRNYCSEPRLIPYEQSLNSNPLEIISNMQAHQPTSHSPQLNQYVQFLKFTISPNGKINCKESIGKIIRSNQDYVEIVDYLGDIIQTNIRSFKILNNVDIIFDNTYEINAI